jgi:hypothetical protein
MSDLTQVLEISYTKACNTQCAKGLIISPALLPASLHLSYFFFKLDIMHTIHQSWAYRQAWHQDTGEVNSQVMVESKEPCADKTPGANFSSSAIVD